MSNKKRCPRLFRLKKRPRKIRKNRRSKKTFREPAIISLIVVIRITNKNSFNTFQKSFRKNHKNSNLFVQKRGVKAYYVSLIKKQRQTTVSFDFYFDENSINHITRILRSIVRTNKTPEGLANNLSRLKTTALSFDSTMYPLSFSVVMLAFTKYDLYDLVLPLSENRSFALANHWTVLKLVITSLFPPDLLFIPNSTLLSRRNIKIEECVYDFLKKPLYFEKNRDDNLGDDQKSKADDGKPEIQEQEDDSLYRHIRELASCYSPEKQQAFKDGLWDSDDLNLGRESCLSLPGGSQDYFLSTFFSKAYTDFQEKKEDLNEYEKLLYFPSDWKLLAIAYNKIANGYFGIAYWYPENYQVVIANQGTKPTKSGDLWTGIVFNGYVAQMRSVATFSEKITERLSKISKDKFIEFQLFFTGHSLGGWLAQITTFITEYIYSVNDLFQKNSKPSRYHAHTVVFDSPGCSAMLSQMKESFNVRYTT